MSSRSIYDDGNALLRSFLVDRAGEQCAGGKACWKAVGTKGYGYKDKEGTAGGVSKVKFVGGAAGKGKADAKGKNNSAKGQLALPTGVFERE